jgi:hypothetical protein
MAIAGRCKLGLICNLRGTTGPVRDPQIWCCHLNSGGCSDGSLCISQAPSAFPLAIAQPMRLDAQLGEVRVLDGTDRDAGAPVYAMALAIRDPDSAAVEMTLQLDVRAQSREVTADLLKLFTGKVHHHVFEATEYAPAARQ